MNPEDKLQAMIEKMKRDPQLQEEREKYAATISAGLDRFKNISPEVMAAVSYPNVTEMQKQRRAAEIAQLGKPHHGVLSLPEFEALCGLKPFLGIVESALREYANSSRDLDEQLHARRAIDAVIDAQKVQP